MWKTSNFIIIILRRVKLKKIVVLLLLFLVFVSVSLAHSGRTDANGGHMDKKTGTYHYHNSGKSSSSTSSSSSSSKTQTPIKKVTVDNIGSYVYVTQDANLRTAPSLDSDIIKVIKKDSLVKLLSIKDTWAKIETIEVSNKEVWISLSLLRQ